MKLKLIFLAALLLLSGGMPARADAFSDRMDRVKEGMYPASVVMVMGEPETVRQTRPAQFVYYYHDSRTKKTWTVTFVRNRVDSVDEL
jgi:KaiC/GvpD/RAD55 family RecA-like ATPase